MSETIQQTRAPATVAPAETPGVGGLLSLAVFVVVVAALYFAREVLIPITLAILLSFVLAPIVGLLRRIRIPHVAAVLLAVLVGFGAILAIGGLIGVQIAGLATDVPTYAATIQKKITTIQGQTVGRLATLTSRLDKQMGRATTPETASPAEADLGAQAKAQLVQIQPPPTSALNLARTVLAPILDPLSTTLIIIIVAVFILMQQEDLRDRLIRLFGSQDLHRTTVALDDAGRRLGKYFLSQLAINATFGLIIGLGLYFIGVPSPALWGVLSALLRFVPYIGPVIAALLPTAVAAAVAPGWTLVLWTLGLYVVSESITGQVVEPLVYGHSTGLSPTAVVIAAIFWTWIWGPIGLVLSTPLTLCLVVLGRHVDRLEFLDVMLGDRPALTPVENFYQRMLADDPDEAEHQAEQMLKDRSLTAYYDEVALKGLQLAANDALRGVLNDDKVHLIRDNVMALINDLSTHEDKEPHPDEKADAEAASTLAERAVPKPAAPTSTAPEGDRLAEGWRGATPVLCLAGRGPLDEAAAAMLAQLLAKHGLAGRIAAHTEVSRSNIASFDPTGIAMVCISYLEISGSPNHLHYLMRRLRSRMPGVSILVGVWPAENSDVSDKRIRNVIGADHYTANLKDAVDTCVRVAHEAARLAPAAAPEPALA